MMLLMEFLYFLGLTSNPQGTSGCPSRYTLDPCSCNSHGSLELSCYTGSLKSIGIAIDRTVFDEKLFSRLELGDILITEPIKEDIFKDLSFDYVSISGRNVHYLDNISHWLHGSVDVLQDLTVMYTNITDENFRIEAMNDFIKLRNFRITGNSRLKTLPKINSDYLQQLYLVRNAINSFPVDVLANIPNLQYLFLDENSLQNDQVTKERFSKSKNLTSLDLTNNKLTRIEVGTFGQIPSLETLRLAKNDITAIDPGAFEGLQNLQNLQLELNPLTTIPIGLFTGLKSLQNLHLGRNNITSIEPEAFAELNNCTVDLDRTDIFNIEESWARPLFESNNKLSFSLKDGHRLECDCNLSWFFKAEFYKQMEYSFCYIGNKTRSMKKLTDTIISNLNCS